MTKDTTTLHKGDYVMHDFSKIKGQILEVRTGNLGYKYLVRWRNSYEDWYQKGVLVKL